MACATTNSNNETYNAEIEKIMSSVTFVGFNINRQNEDFFQTNVLLGVNKQIEEGGIDMTDIQTLFTGMHQKAIQLDLVKSFRRCSDIV